MNDMRTSQTLPAADLAAAKAQFDRDGFYVIPGAVDPALADRICAEMRSIDETSSYVGFIKKVNVIPSKANQQHHKFRFKDLYVNNADAREAVFSPVIIDTMCALTGHPMLAFQSLGFVKGSGLRIHNDANFVSVDQPQSVVGCWLALEDIEPGCGELIYYPGSHRFPLYEFGNGSAHKDKKKDGIYGHEPYVNWLAEQIKINHLEEKRFTAKKGDCLIWHAYLVHAGSPVTRIESSRYSFATHFCALDARPNYFNHFKKASLVKHAENCYFTSRHYDMREISTSEELAHTVLPPLGLVESFTP